VTDECLLTVRASMFPVFDDIYSTNDRRPFQCHAREVSVSHLFLLLVPCANVLARKIPNALSLSVFFRPDSSRVLGILLRT